NFGIVATIPNIEYLSHEARMILAQHIIVRSCDDGRMAAEDGKAEDSILDEKIEEALCSEFHGLIRHDGEDSEASTASFQQRDRSHDLRKSAFPVLKDTLAVVQFGRSIETYAHR